MRVVHLADYAAPYRGGFVPMLLAAARAGEARGWRTELIGPPGAEEREWFRALPGEGLPASVAPTRDRRALSRWLRDRVGGDDEPTILHTHFTLFDLPAVSAAVGRRPVRVIWHIHNRPPRDLPMRVRNTVTFGAVGRGVDRILCVAPDTAEELRARLAPRRRTVFFPNAIDTDRFRPPSDEERGEVRSQLGVEGAEAVLLHFGWDWRVKGGDAFAAIVRELRDRGRDVVGITVGGGEEARQTAERTGLDGALRAVEPVPDVRRWHAAADAVISCSEKEGMPFSVIEALAAGVPAVASNATAGHAAIATDLASLRLVDPAPAAFADGVEALLGRDAAAAEREAADGRAAMRTRFDLVPWAERLMDVYAEITPRRAPATA